MYHERYLVNLKDIDFYNFKYSYVKESIEEFMINDVNGNKRLFSKKTINGISGYSYLEILGSIKICHTLSFSDYNCYFNENKGKVLKKIRYNFIDNGQRMQLNLYKMEDNIFAILEIDTMDIKGCALPSFIHKALDITNNHDYDDDSIFAHNGIREIEERSKIKSFC